MLYKIIYLLNYVTLQNNIITFLLSFIGVNTKIKPELLNDIRYRHFTVDSPPINRRKASPKVNNSVICQIYGAPHEYIYDNNGNKGTMIGNIFIL